jgi:hypothetical protein
MHPGQSAFVNLRAQATASSGALWAASARASGAADPVEDLTSLDEALLVAAGVDAGDLGRERLRAYQWAAEMYDLAGYSDMASVCWRGARTEASALSVMDERKYLIDRARWRRSRGRSIAALLDYIRARGPLRPL